MGLQTYYFILLFLCMALWTPDSLSTQGLLFQNGFPLYHFGSNLGHSEQDEVSPRTQFQGLNLSRAWSWREIFNSQVQMQKTGKHKLFAKEKNVKMDIP